MPAVGDVRRRPFHRFVLLQVVEGDETAALLHLFGQQPGRLAGVESVRRLGDGGQRLGQVGLGQGVAGLPLAAARPAEHPSELGVRRLRVVQHAVQPLRQPGRHREAVAGQPHRRLDQLLPRPLAVRLVGQGEPPHRAWHAGRDRRLVVDPDGEHVGLGRCRGHLAEVEERRFLPLARMHQHESTAADVAGFWPGHGLGEADGHRGIDRRAAGLQDRQADIHCRRRHGGDGASRAFRGMDGRSLREDQQQGEHGLRSLS